MLQAHFDRHPMRKLFNPARKGGARARKDLPYVVEATRLLRTHYPHLPETVLNRRLTSLSMMFLATVVEHDNAKLRGKATARGQFDLDPVLDMAMGALSA